MASDIIRRAVPADADALCRLNREFNGEDTADASHIRNCLSSPSAEVCYVCERRSHLTGFVCGICFDSLCYRNPVAQITELYVQVEARRCGTAYSLMSALIDHFRNMGTEEIRLETGPDNQPARRLYEKLGFEYDDECTYSLQLN